MYGVLLCTFLHELNMPKLLPCKTGMLQTALGGAQQESAPGPSVAPVAVALGWLTSCGAS